MNDSELHSIIRRSRTPEPESGYWDGLTNRVMKNLGRRPVEQPARDRWLAPMALGGALALACVLIGFWIGEGHRQTVASIYKDEQRIRREIAAVPNQLSRMMQSEHKFHAIIADMP